MYKNIASMARQYIISSNVPIQNHIYIVVQCVAIHWAIVQKSIVCLNVRLKELKTKVLNLKAAIETSHTSKRRKESISSTLYDGFRV